MMPEQIKHKTATEKLAIHFGVKIAESGKILSKAENEDRTIKAIANTYFYIDSDLDMLIPGCCKKTIADKGPQSKATAKIKHQSDHDIKTTSTVGRITVLDERQHDGKEVLYFESFIPETRKGNDNLINYQQGLYDNHSIGFIYRDLILAEKNSSNELSRKAWEDYYPRALNPEKADKYGYFFVVKEIELFEISVVSFGANALTPNLTGKSLNDNKKLITEILERIDVINEQLKSSNLAKEVLKNTEIEVLQLKQIISDLKLQEPSKNPTQQEEHGNNDTEEEESPTIKNNLLTNIAKNL